MGVHRIAMVAACPFPESRGTPTRILRMAEALVRRGHEVHIVTYHLGGSTENSGLNIHRTAKIATYQKRTPGPSFQKLILLDPLLSIKLITLLRRQKIDVIHAHHFEGVMVSWLAHIIFKKPLVFDVHTLLESELPSYGANFLQPLKKYVGRLLDKYVPRFASKIVAVSEDIREKLNSQHGYTKRSISIIPNGVETELFSRIVEPKKRDIENRPNILVFAGNLSSYQKVDLLLEAFHEVCKARSDVRLKILTSGDFEVYESLAKKLSIRERIDIKLCALENLPAELASASIALNPRTICDGLPQKLLNYMAAGVPVVTFEGSAKHFVHEQHGLVVENGNTKEFSRAILKLLDDPELSCKYGENARNFVLNEMSWDKTAKDVEQVYNDILYQA